MASDAAPVVIAYDGSEVSKEAVRHAAELFAGRAAIVVTVWEPGLAFLPIASDPFLAGAVPPDPEAAQAVDEAEREHAARVAEEGAKLARSLGLEATPHPVPDEDVVVADTLIHFASEREAAVIVVGTRGISGLRTHVLGSVT